MWFRVGNEVTCTFGHLSMASPGHERDSGRGGEVLGFPTTVKDENKYVKGDGRAGEVEVCP